MLWGVVPHVPSAERRQGRDKMSMWWKWQRKSLLIFFCFLPGLVFIPGLVFRWFLSYWFEGKFEGKVEMGYSLFEFFFGLVVASLLIAIFLLARTSYHFLHIPTLQRPPYFLFQMSFAITALALVVLITGGFIYASMIVFLVATID